MINQSSPPKLTMQTKPRNSAKIEAELSPIEIAIFDQLLYKDRIVIEHANAGIDGFKVLLVLSQKLDVAPFHGIYS